MKHCNIISTISGDNKDTLAIGELPTPSSTPTSVRKNRRRSNLFTPGKGGKNEDKKGGLGGDKDKGEVGSGRSIPVRQGYLYKKSNKSFSKVQSCFGFKKSTPKFWRQINKRGGGGFLIRRAIYNQYCKIFFYIFFNWRYQTYSRNEILNLFFYATVRGG